MKTCSIVFVGALCLSVACQMVLALRPDAKDTRNEYFIEPRSEKRQNENISALPDVDSSMDNEIYDRIQVVEPYKSLIKTTARFAIAQSRVSNYINIDTAMDALNSVGYVLSKPATLVKAIKIVAVAITSIIATVFMFPGSQQFLDALYQNPSNLLQLDTFLSNGVSERSVLGVISSNADEAWNKVGLNKSSCRERSICYIGEMLKCSMPQTSDVINDFFSDNFPNASLRNNKYVKAFASGFKDRNCTIVGTGDSESPSCIANFINSFVKARQRKK